jgi:hypothetical protein
MIRTARLEGTPKLALALANAAIGSDRTPINI